VVILFPPFDDFGFAEGQLTFRACLIIGKTLGHAPVESPGRDPEKLAGLPECENFHLILEDENVFDEISQSVSYFVSRLYSGPVDLSLDNLVDIDGAQPASLRQPRLSFPLFPQPFCYQISH